MTDPIYKQVSDVLLELVRTEYAPGSQFLTERQISERFGISRTTANKALANLVVDGVLLFRKGVGTFVAVPKANVDLKRLVSFTGRARAAGHEPATRTRRFALTTVGELRGLRARDVAEALDASRGTRVYEIERIRSIDGEPVVFESRALLADYCPDLLREQTEGSLYSIFSEVYGLELAGVAQRIRARGATAAQAKTLATDRGAALLELTGVGYLANAAAELPLWYEVTLYRGDAYEFINQVRASGPVSQASVSHAGPTGQADARPRWFDWEQSDAHEGEDE